MSKTRTIREQCEYVAEFMKDTWDTGLLNPPNVNWGKGGKPDKPPTALELEDLLTADTFPGMNLLELDEWEYKAGLWFYLKSFAGENKKELYGQDAYFAGY
jgi:hypothetical protein